ncbi:DUF6542 domain-containing protein [Streptomyces sp. O3]
MGRAVRTVGRGVLAVRRMPNPRLTGLGGGLFAGASMLVFALLDRLLLGGSIAVYGVLSLLVSAVTALWVRPADLVTAPVAVPLAFAIGLLPIAGGSDGVGGQVMGLLTALAVSAGWLYGATLIAGLVVTVRKVRIMGRRKRRVRESGRVRDSRQVAGPRQARQAGGARPVQRRAPDS